MKIKLQTVINAIEESDDVWTNFLDLKTGETVYLGDTLVVGEMGDIYREQIENEPERYLRFPTQYEIHEYSIIEDFVDSLLPGKIQNELISAIHGRGAFRRFKNTIRYYGIEQLWYDYQANAYREIAVRWCQDNELEYE